MKVIICGLGAIGLTYANKFKACSDLKILVDEERLKKYTKNPPVFNGEEVFLDYILPKENFIADLIILSTKNNGLIWATENIKNFIGEKTIILSLLNGVKSEEQLISKYEKDKILHSFYIGHSAIRDETGVHQDGINTIVFGSPYPENEKKIQKLKTFFHENNISYQNPTDILYEQWVKFGVNVVLNQLSVLCQTNIGELKKSNIYKNLAPKLLDELEQIAKAHKIKVDKNYSKDVYKAIDIVNGEGKTSMLQDILAKRKTEVDIFSGTIIEFGKKYGIKTPYNDMIYKKIKETEKNL